VKVRLCSTELSKLRKLLHF